jgi:dihydrodiol dehydrogenase / D-xylose 1-dehydrogenase (NADP)
MNSINWGILGCGNIAVSFARDLAVLRDARLLGVASKSKERAENLGKSFGVERRYYSYSELASDPDIDAIYVATRHHDHLSAASLCIENGKSVLVEKPFCVNAAEAEQLIALTRKRNVFLMEAMWTRFLPVIKAVKERIKKGDIGAVSMLFADFGFKAPYDPQSRVFNPELAGGALLDIGVYPISFASLIFEKQPDEISSDAIIGTTSVDEQSSYLFRYGDHALAILASTVRGISPRTAHIVGENGSFHIPQFWKARSASLIRGEKTVEVLEPAFQGSGYNYQAQEVIDCIRRGETESSIMPLGESLAIMHTMDRVRDQIGLKYPFETE